MSWRNDAIIEQALKEGDMDRVDSMLLIERWVMLLEAGATKLGFEEWLAELKNERSKR